MITDIDKIKDDTVFDTGCSTNDCSNEAFVSDFQCSCITEIP